MTQPAIFFERRCPCRRWSPTGNWIQFPTLERTAW